MAYYVKSGCSAGSYVRKSLGFAPSHQVLKQLPVLPIYSSFLFT